VFSTLLTWRLFQKTRETRSGRNAQPTAGDASRGILARRQAFATLGLENDLWDPPKNNFGIRSGLMGFADQVL
jgi:hypothetical protein